MRRQLRLAYASRYYLTVRSSRSGPQRLAAGDVEDDREPPEPLGRRDSDALI